MIEWLANMVKKKKKKKSFGRQMHAFSRRRRHRFWAHPSILHPKVSREHDNYTQPTDVIISSVGRNDRTAT